jgi:hypothetical protein
MVQGGSAFVIHLQGGPMGNSLQELVSAMELERSGVLQRQTAYRMARAGQIPCYAVGAKGRGIRFRIEEVLEALRRPAKREIPHEG